MELTPKQLDRVKKTLEVVEKGDIAVTKLVFQLEEHVDEKIDSLSKELAAIPAKIEAVKTIKGDKGDTGERGEKGEKGDKPVAGVDFPLPLNGVDGKTPTKKQLVSIIKPLIPEVINGIDGIDGTNGKDGKDGSPDTGEQILEKINSLPLEDEFKLDASRIKNLPKAENRFIPGGNGTQPVKAGTGISITYDGNGAPVINSNGSGSGDVVGPASAVGNNVVFFDGATGKIIKDSGLTLSGNNTGDQDLSGYQPLVDIVEAANVLDIGTVSVTDINIGRLAGGNTVNIYSDAGGNGINITGASVDITALTSDIKVISPSITFDTLLKNDGTGNLVTAIAGVDYATPGSVSSFETVSKNIEAFNNTVTYDGSGNVDYMTYSNGVIKTFAYSSGNVSTITLSGSIPPGIDTVKTFTYDGDGNVETIVYT